MQRIAVKSIPRPEGESVDDLLARFCYYYPQYTMAQAKKMAYVRVVKMLNVVTKEKAKFLLELTKIIASPHYKNGNEVKKLAQGYQRIITGE